MAKENTVVSSNSINDGPKKEVDSFPRFDFISGKETDHYYFNQRPGVKLIKSSSSSPTAPLFPAHKKIMQEWRILEDSLPDSIYVRVYETRVDLMRAVIVGASGTPYHDGLFFFDMCFPPQYPASPPLVHYKSFGVRINPNLYDCGRVCLSLLNTWSGEKNERWNPKESTVLQVLLSIQALVLNEKPYYNEPNTPISEKKSDAYSEDVFILSCKTMAWLLGRPPMGFEPFIAAHFRRRALSILAACQAYSSGQANVGYYGVAAGRQPGQASPASERFKSSMREVYPTLLSAFRKEGASVGDFVRK